MTDHIISPDGKFMWTGSEWIPAPPNTTTETTSSASVQGSIVKVDTQSVVVQDSIVKVEGANNASYHNPTIQSEQNIDYVESSKYNSPIPFILLTIGLAIPVLMVSGNTLYWEWSFICGSCIGLPIILIARHVNRKPSQKYVCGACDKVNKISTAVGLVQKTTSGHQSITSINPAVGVTTSGTLGVGGITTTSQIPIELGSVVWTDECNHCGKPNRWIKVEKIRRWTEPSSNQFSFEIGTKSGPK
jgi:hypothetical protein